MRLVVLPPAPVLDTPINGFVHPGLTVELNWFPAEGAARYEIQVDNNSSFKTPKIKKSIDGPATNTEVTFPFAGGFYWRVESINYLGHDDVAWSAARYLRVTTTP